MVCRFDADVERHFARNGIARIVVDARDDQLRVILTQQGQLLVEIAVLADIDHDDLKIGILLLQHQRQTLLDEAVIFGEHRHDE